jgi:predicted nucleic acid-binding protein
VTLLDAYALVAFLVGGPAAASVRAILHEGDAAVVTANLAEVLDVSQRVHGLPIARSMELIDPLLEEALSLIPLDLAVARRAARLRAAHYHRSSRPISLADAVLIASAKREDRVATADPDVLAVAESEGISTIPLPGQAPE